MSIFKGQKLLTIKLDCVTDIAAGTEFKILYKKPDGTSGEWEATRDGSTNKVQKTFTDGDLDQVGTWNLQSYVVIGGLSATGDIVEIDVKKPLI